MSRLFQQRNFHSSKQLEEQSMLLKLSCVILLIIQRDTESTRVIGECRTVVLGEDVDLYCRMIETTEDLEQITWQKSTLEETQNHNFMLINPNGVTKFIAPNGLSGRVLFIGNPSENLGSIRITAVRLLDEGTFTCIFSVFPSGTYTTEICLTVLGKNSSFTLCITVSMIDSVERLNVIINTRKVRSWSFHNSSEARAEPSPTEPSSSIFSELRKKGSQRVLSRGIRFNL